MTPDDYSLRLISALTDLWNAIRARHPGVPAVVLLPAPSPSRKMNTLGHFAPLRWKAKRATAEQALHEVVVVAEHLDRGAEDILETLLHEAAHAANHEKKIKDCTRSQYHNAQFRSAAEALGLAVSTMPHYGHAHTVLAKGTLELYADGVERLRSVVISRRKPSVVVGPIPSGGEIPSDGDDQDGDEGSRSRHLKATCACPLVIRASKKTLAATTIRCETCDEPFRIAP